ncbi:MAG: hypothetical protein EBR02_00655 [Alphaproteobacteria bacterium]|nr:hypothetical protein [Alphaproteobacteria bacterium]
MTEKNPYLETIHQNLPRVLALFNADESDRYYGCGDRQFWAWKLIDFPNATMQGVVYGLAMLYQHDLLPEGFSKPACLKHILAMIDVLPQLMDRHGGLAEAMPNESSFCVTGLVLGDVLGALNTLRAELTNDTFKQKLKLCEPMVAFLKSQDEFHGIISNHLASSALGLIRWGLITGDEQALARAGLWIGRIKKHANDEGWMSEYSGADPGYQSWCSSALAQIHQLTPRYEVENLLTASYRFLAYFAFPDGTFANGIGYRLTRFFFPGGAEICTDISPNATQLALFARTHYAHNRFVTLNAIDAPNIAPFFNDIVLAAVHWKPLTVPMRLPYHTMHPNETTYFEKAGVLIHYSASHVSAISIHRGGWMARVQMDGSRQHLQPEYYGTDTGNNIFCAHKGTLITQGNVLTISAELHKAPRMTPSPFKFIILRILTLTAFRSKILGNATKWLLIQLLYPAGKARGIVTRTIDLSSGAVEDTVHGLNLSAGNAANQHFSTRHMASQGYWQASDEAS